MTDWTYSFVRNASMLPDKYERVGLTPSKEENTTMLKLDCLRGQSASLVCTCFEGNDEITDATPEGWSERPAQSFGSSEPFAHFVEFSPLAAVRTVLRKPIEVTNISFSPDLYDAISDKPKFSHKLLLWHIPSILDPTYHQKPAIQFDEIGDFISRKRTRRTLSARSRHNDLVRFHRGWASSVQAETPVATESSEKTNFFIFTWKDTDAEIRVKDGKEEDPWQEPWPDKFMAIQEEWKAMGMRSEGIHLSLWDFWFQLHQLEHEAKQAERDRMLAMNRETLTEAK
ncbi:MAG: hypothetical protein Q9184_005509 [Pyrenodesmia sp. 2 TL-2023]